MHIIRISTYELQSGEIRCAGCDEKLGFSYDRTPPEQHLMEECFEKMRYRIQNIEDILKNHNLR